MEEFFNRLKDMQGVTRFEISGDHTNLAKHIKVTVSRVQCSANEIEEVQKMLHNQNWFEWTFDLVP